MSTVSYRRRGSTRKSKGAFPITSQEESNFENNISDTDEEEPEYLAPLTLTSDEEEHENGDDDNEDDDSLKENDRSILSDRTNTGKVVTISITPTKQKAGQTSKDMKNRRRRRSSARFLSLSGRFHGDVSSSSLVDNNGDTDLYSSSDPNGSSGSMNGLQATLKENRELGEMYRQAIRMNAENRINAGNSWSLNLIENIDKFLDDDEDEAKNEDDGVTNYLEARREGSQDSMMNEVDLARDSLEDSTTGLKRVNFTKASCTIDASVKIYSYRVDDVHLTSYKVLANLNRTDTTGKDSEEDGDKSKRASSKASGLGERKQSERRGMDSTIETRVGKFFLFYTVYTKLGIMNRNFEKKEERSHTFHFLTSYHHSMIENINMSKMDSAFDIDPLFHKMSKTFDEGGAKGLLLVNLGVASDSCRIVFDSSEQAASSAAVSDEGKNTISNPMLSTSMSENDSAQDDEEQEEGEEMDMDEKNSPDETNPMDMSGTSEDNERRLMGEEDEFMNNNSLDPIIAPLGECSESNENSVNITCLCDKFRSILGTSSFSEVPFMSQLSTVKEEYAKLESDGYVGLSVPAAPPISKRYGISEKEEREAEEVIHREALERTKMAEINTSTVVGGLFGTPIAAIDDHDDAGDHNFDMMGSDENDHDFGDESSVSPGMFNETMMSHTFINESMEIQPSFYNDLNISYNTGVGFTSGNENKNQKVVGEGAMAPFNEKGTTARLLDFICNSDNLAPGSSAVSAGEKFEYFDASLLDKFATKDSWMGSTHWKKSDKLVRKTTKKGSSNNKSPTQSAGSKSKKNRTFINLFCPANELDAEELLKEASTNTKKTRTKKSSKDSDKDLFQLSKATITKQKKLDYLLPPDANIDINELFKLFQRPDARFVSYENCITPGNNSLHEGEIDMDHGHRDGMSTNIYDY